MGALKQLLSFLDKKGVDLVILQEGAAPHVRRTDGLHPISRQPSTRQEMEAMLESVGLTIPSQQAPFTMEGRRFSADAVMRKDRLRIRFSNAQAAAPPPPPSRVEAASSSSLEKILAETRRAGASDVHISSGYPAQVRLMGELSGTGEPLSPEAVRRMLYSLLDDVGQQRLDKNGYIDLAVELVKSGRFRVNISRQRGGLKGCFRLLPDGPKSLSELGLPDELGKITLHHQGLVVVSGPNGAGKTTTLAALVDLFNSTRPVHILTMEDPVEILHAPKKAVISQREVGRHTRSFQSALKGALREDPDVIAIGELRDLETVEMALSAAETGHLVIATMSTPSGAVTIDRLIDMFPRNVQSQVRSTLAGTLKMIISQRLVPGNGGRQYAAVELITGNIPLYAMIRDNKLFQLPNLQQQGRAYGMIRLEDSLNDLIDRGSIEPETARAYANNPNVIRDPGAAEQIEAPPEPDKPASRFGMKQMAQKLRGK